MLASLLSPKSSCRQLMWRCVRDGDRWCCQTRVDMLCQKLTLLLFFYSILTDVPTEEGLSLLAFLTRAIMKFRLPNKSWGIPTLLPSHITDSYLTDLCSRSSMARMRRNGCRRPCRGRGSRRGLGIPPRRQTDYCRRENPQRRRSWCRQTPPPCRGCSYRVFRGSGVAWRSPTPWRPSWWLHGSRTRPPLGCSSECWTGKRFRVWVCQWERYDRHMSDLTTVLNVRDA